MLSAAVRGTMAPAHARVLDELRGRIARIEQAGRPQHRVVPFGLAEIDARLPQGGLVIGALHEIAGGGLGAIHAAAAVLFVAGVLARLDGTVLWCLRTRDLFTPALAGAGLHPDRVIFAECGNERTVGLSQTFSDQCASCVKRQYALTSGYRPGFETAEIPPTVVLKQAWGRAQFPYKLIAEKTLRQAPFFYCFYLRRPLPTFSAPKASPAASAATPSPPDLGTVFRVCQGQMTSFRALQRLLRMAKGPSFPVR